MNNNRRDIEVIVILLMLLGFSSLAEAADRFWVGGSGNWSQTIHWSTKSGGSGGASVPGDKDTAIFDGNSAGGTCTINQTVDIRGLDMRTGNTTAISQGAYTVTIGIQDAVFTAGTFTGGTADIDINGTFTLNGASFSSTSGTMYIGNTFTISSGTFTHNSGTVVFDTNNFTITPGSATFNNVTFNAARRFTIASGTTLTVSGTLSLTDGTINTGTLAAQGNVTIGASADGGTATLSLTGTGDQTITGNSGGVFQDTLDIYKSSGTATITGTCSGIQAITVSSGTLDFAGGYTYTIDDADSITVSAGATLNLTGSKASLVTLRSDHPVNQWDLNVNTAANYRADYVDVRNSNALGRKIFATNSTDSGRNTNWYFVPGSLSTADIEPACLQVNAKGLVSISFTTQNPFPADGLIEIDFPSGFNGTGCNTVSNASGIDGSFSIATSNGDGTNDIISITRSAGSEVSASTAVSFSINSITNPSATGSTGTYSVKTQDKGAVPTIDQDNSVSADTMSSAISKIVFTTTNQTLVQNQVSNLITIQTQDSTGNARDVCSDTVINLTSSSSGGSFSLNASPWESINSVTISAGQNSVSFYYKDSVVGTPTVTASESPSLGWTDATQVETIRSAINTFSVTAISPQVAGSAFTLTITAIGEDGAIATGFLGTVNLSVNYISPASGSGTLYVTSTSNFINGVATITDQTFSDCGIITITATKSDDSTKSGTSTNIVFIPYDFAVSLDSTVQTANKAFSLKVTARNAQGATCPNYKGTANLSIVYILPSSNQSGTITPSSLGSTDFTNGIATITTTKYDKWGRIKIKAAEALDTTRYGESQEIMFNPRDFLITLSTPPKSRSFYYKDEEFTATVTARDQDNNTITNYQGSIELSSSQRSLSSRYTFLSSDSGIHKFLVSFSSPGKITLTAKDTTYTTITGSSSEFEVKEAKIKVFSTAGPVGNVAVLVKILDAQDKVISDDDSTTFTVSLQESTDNGSATCEATTTSVTIQGGVATIYVKDIEAETVTITPSTSPVLTPVAGTVTFGSFRRRGIGIDMWREIK